MMLRTEMEMEGANATFLAYWHDEYIGRIRVTRWEPEGTRPIYTAEDAQAIPVVSSGGFLVEYDSLEDAADGIRGEDTRFSDDDWEADEI